MVLRSEKGDGLRTGQLSAEHRAQALANFKRTIAESFFKLPVSSRHFRAAGTFAGQYTLGCRRETLYIWRYPPIMD
jgi:hypothetical protein